MPAFLTHKVAADNILNAIGPTNIKKIIEENMDAYQSGAQGGDYYQLYKYYSMWAGKSYKMFGYALHRARPQRFFCEGAEYIKKRPSDLLKAFFYGYITHYYLDLYLHPHINKGTNAMTTHNILESAIDVMYADKYGLDALAFNKGEYVKNTYVDTNEFSAFFEVMKKKLYYGFTLKKNSYQTTYRYFEKLERLLYRPDKKTMRYLKFRNKFMILDILTLLYKPKEEILDWYDYEFYFALLDKAVAKSAEIITDIDAFLNDKKDISVLWSKIYNVNFHGKPVTPREERLAFRRLYRKAKLKW